MPWTWLPSAGAVVGDGKVDRGDLVVLLRSLSGHDVDSDGLPHAFEARLGLSPSGTWRWRAGGASCPDR